MRLVNSNRASSKYVNLSSGLSKKDLCVTPPTCSDDGVSPPSVVRVMSGSGCSVSMARSVSTSI